MTSVEEDWERNEADVEAGSNRKTIDYRNNKGYEGPDEQKEVMWKTQREIFMTESWMTTVL